MHLYQLGTSLPQYHQTAQQMTYIQIPTPGLQRQGQGKEMFYFIFHYSADCNMHAFIQITLYSSRLGMTYNFLQLL